MRVSRSGYDAWRQRGPDPDRDHRIALIKAIHKQKSEWLAEQRYLTRHQARQDIVGGKLVTESLCDITNKALRKRFTNGGWWRRTSRRS